MQTLGIIGMLIAANPPDLPTDGAIATSAPRIEIDATRATVTVAVSLPTNLIEQLPDGPVTSSVGERWLRLHLSTATESPENPPILGRYHKKGTTLRFSPRFPLSPGSGYQVVVTLPGQPPKCQVFQMPASPSGPPPEVVGVYPTADVLPANLLKFYLHFSYPMRTGPTVFEQIQLLDGKGVPIQDPWRRTELWNDDDTRLTLWIHPGRIKTGVNLREQLGPVLQPNQEYTLRILPTLVDARGRPLAREFRKTFRTVTPIREVIPDDGWKVSLPPAGTRQPLKLHAPRPLDRALYLRSVTVLTSDHQLVLGQSQVTSGEKTWSWIPAAEWRSEKYMIVLDELLEDLAGNTFLSPFERDIQSLMNRKPRLAYTIELCASPQKLPLGPALELRRGLAR